MPNPLPRIATQAGYVDAVSIQDVFGGRGGSFAVENQPVKYQLQYGKLGETFWTEEADLLPGPGSIEAGTIGVRFRSSGAQAATVSGRIAPKSQPILTSTGAGAIGAALITGKVALDGSIISGTGFTAVRNGAGTGNYTITFTTPFAAAPVVTLTIVAQIGFIISSPQVTASILTVRTFNSGAAAVDAAFDFTAEAVI